MNRYRHVAFIILALLLFASTLPAQTPPEDAGMPAAADPDAAVAGVAADTAPTLAPVQKPDPVPSTEQLLREAQMAARQSQEALAIYRNEQASTASKVIAISGALMILFTVLLDGLKKVAALAPWLRHKQWVRLVTLALGGLVYLCAQFAAGLPWWEALAIGLSGPLAQVFKASVNLARTGKWEEAGAAAPSK